MNKDEITERLLTYYRPYGVSEEQITNMIDTGIEADIAPEVVLYNVFCQLAEEYVGASEAEVFDGAVKIIGVPADELLELLTE